MLYQANMPKSFWAKAMSTAAYIINRLPSSSINEAISFELWHEKVLDSKELKLLKSFKCIVNIHISQQRCKPLSKVNTRSTLSCFIATTPPCFTKFEISNGNVSSILAIKYSKKLSSPKSLISMNRQKILTIIPGIRDNTRLSQSLSQSRIGQSTMKFSFYYRPHLKSSQPMVQSFKKTTIHSRLPML